MTLALLQDEACSEQTADVLLQTLWERDAELGAHARDVADLACATAMHLGVSDDDIQVTRETALLHDIGKAEIPDEILTKPGVLDAAEWVFMKRHTIIGERMISATPALEPIARLVRSTHERFDGQGYPDGLAGEDIPLIARIVAVCDAYDAVVTTRTYRKARGSADAIAELRSFSGTQFDPEVVEACIDALDDSAAARFRLPTSPYGGYPQRFTRPGDGASGGNRRW